MSNKNPITVAASLPASKVTHGYDLDFMMPMSNYTFQISVQKLVINPNRKYLINTNLVQTKIH